MWTHHRGTCLSATGRRLRADDSRPPTLGRRLAAAHTGPATQGRRPRIGATVAGDPLTLSCRVTPGFVDILAPPRCPHIPEARRQAPFQPVAMAAGASRWPRARRAGCGGAAMAAGASRWLRCRDGPITFSRIEAQPTVEAGSCRSLALSDSRGSWSAFRGVAGADQMESADGAPRFMLRTAEARGPGRCARSRRRGTAAACGPAWPRRK